MAALHLAVNPHQLETPERVWFWATRGIEREQWQQWVAEEGSEIVGSAWAGLEWAVPTPGKGRFWIAVAHEHRRRGIGATLYGVVEEYLRGHEAWRARAKKGRRPGGRAVPPQARVRTSGHGHRLRACACRRRAGRALGTWLLDRAARSGARPDRGSLRDLRRRRGRHARRRARDGDDAGRLEARRLRLARPLARRQLRRVEGEGPVSLAFLAIDPSRKLAYNQMTATLPEFRRRGLALAVKLAAAGWAKANGFERILTENDADNTGMLAINQRLGYRPVYEQTKWALEWEPPPGERG